MTRQKTEHRQRDTNIALQVYQSTPSITHLINFMLTTCSVDGATSLTNKDLEYKSGFKFHALLLCVRFSHDSHVHLYIIINFIMQQLM